MAAATPDLSVLYDKKKYKVITTPTQDEPNVLRCSRQRALGYYINTLKQLLKDHETVIIMGAGKAVATAEAVSNIALNIEANLHKLSTKGTEKHSFTFENKEDKSVVTNERDVEFVRIKIVKKVTEEEKKQEGYAAGPTEVSDETLTQAIRKARSEISGPRRLPRRRGPRPSGVRKEGEEGDKKPRRPRGPRRPRAQNGEEGDKPRRPFRRNFRRGGRKPNGAAGEAKKEGEN